MYLKIYLRLTKKSSTTIFLLCTIWDWLTPLKIIPLWRTCSWLSGGNAAALGKREGSSWLRMCIALCIQGICRGRYTPKIGALSMGAFMIDDEIIPLELNCCLASGRDKEYAPGIPNLYLESEKKTPAPRWDLSQSFALPTRGSHTFSVYFDEHPHWWATRENVRLF